MTDILAVILIALLWVFIIGTGTVESAPFNLLVGILLGLFLVSLVSSDERSFPRRIVAYMRFVLSFFKELVVANLIIAKLTLRAHPRYHTHVIAVPIRLESDAAIALLSATITLLPGTVAMGVSNDRKNLYAHAMGTESVEDAKEAVTRMETLIMGFMK